jgi:hypothetical protein
MTSDDVTVQQADTSFVFDSALAGSAPLDSALSNGAIIAWITLSVKVIFRIIAKAPVFRNTGA